METKLEAICLFMVSLFCKYLTYKEWKQTRKSWLSRAYEISVSTLPIRNGNEARATPSDGNDAFSKYLTYKEWKQFSIMS